jgi:predicted nucleic acid-binding protein
MIAYIDTSALTKKYVKEQGSDEVIRHWNNVETIVVSAVAYAEFFSAINRKQREGVLAEDEYKLAIHEFKNDWDTFEKVEVNNLLHDRVEELTAAYIVRGFDAIHLASALCFKHWQGENLSFICADRRLNDAAQQEGLNVVDLS